MSDKMIRRNIQFSEDQYTMLTRLSAEKTVETGKQVSVSELVREAIDEKYKEGE